MRRDTGKIQIRVLAIIGAIAAVTTVTAWIAAFCVVALESCALPNESGPNQGCQYDTQCTGGRICENGTCVFPPEQPAASPSPIKHPPVPATSKDLTNCLQKAQPGFQHPFPLKYVEARVRKNSLGSVTRVALTGQVCTEVGKQHAESKSEECLGVENLKFKNQIEIDPTLCPQQVPPPPEEGTGNGVPPPPPPPPPSNLCVQLCKSDENNCTAKCVQNLAPLIPGLPNFLPFGGNAAACQSQCQNDFDHCRANCDQGGGSSEGGPPPD